MERRRERGALVLATVAFVVLTAIPFGGGAANGPGRDAVHADGAAVALSTEVGALGAATPIQVTLSLEPRDATSLGSFDAALQAPDPPPYLTESEFVNRFAAPTANVSALESYFAGFGAHDFSLSSDQLTLQFASPAQGLGSAFATRLAGGPGSAESSWGWTTAPTLPVELAPMVYGVGGLSRTPSSLVPSLRSLGSGLVRTPFSFVVDGSSGVDLDTGSDFDQAYQEPSLFPGGSATGVNQTFAGGQAVATILMSGYNQTASVNLPPWDPAQIGDYFNDTFAPSWPHPTFVGVPVPLDNTTPPGAGSYGGRNDSSFNEAENSLDLEMAGSAAPGAELVNFYFAASLFENTSSFSPLGPIADDFAVTLGAALSYHYSGHRLDAVSNSYGLPDLNDSAWNLELAHAAALGVTVLAASGDQGNAPESLSGRFQGQWPDWPSSAAFQDFGTVSVGGVTVDIGGTPTGTYNGTTLPDGFDANETGLASQRTWYDVLAGPGNYSGSEGGLSVEIPEPPWEFSSAAQPPIASAGGVQGARVLGRAGPDVAFPANTTIAYVAHDANGTYFALLEGTSIASPFFAGLLAEWSAVAGHPFGWIDPALYRIASYFGATGAAGDPFLDVTQGGNYVFSAAPGWDATTGWGGVLGAPFLAAYANTSIEQYVYTGPTPGLPPVQSPAGLEPPSTASEVVLLVVGLAVTIVLVLLIVWDARQRPRAPAHGPFGVPPWVGAPAPPPPPLSASGAPPPPPVGTAWSPPPPVGAVPPPAMFLCPYCGHPRPAEPVRCPGCGAY